MQQKLFLISFDEKASDTFGRKLKANERSELCRELGSLLNSGVSVVRSFTIISGRDIEPKLKKSIHKHYHTDQARRSAFGRHGNAGQNVS